MRQTLRFTLFVRLSGHLISRVESRLKSFLRPQRGASDLTFSLIFAIWALPIASQSKLGQKIKSIDK